MIRNWPIALLRATCCATVSPVRTTAIREFPLPHHHSTAKSSSRCGRRGGGGGGGGEGKKAKGGGCPPSSLSLSLFIQAMSLQQYIVHIRLNYRLELFTIVKHRKIPNISPEAYIFQLSLLRGLYSEGLIYGRKSAFQNWLGL